MRYAHYKTDGTATIIETKKPIQYEQIRNLVGGSIEFYRTENGQLIYCNETARLDNLPSNPFFYEDIRGNAVEIGSVDENGESLGVSDDYKLRSSVNLPQHMFEKGNKYTLFWVDPNFGFTNTIEIETTGDAPQFQGKPVFKKKGGKTLASWQLNNSSYMIFRGWNLPIKSSCTTTGKLRMNFMFNMTGVDIIEMYQFILDGQINPFFVSKDHILHISLKDQEYLVFPNVPPSTQSIADMQSAQLKDGISRTVIG